MSAPYLKITSDFQKEFNNIVKAFKKDAVLVGIPQNDKTREEGAGINNATLLAINNFGSPGQNIPARPVMSIGIRNAQEPIAAEFKKAAQKVFTQGRRALETYYERAGIIASNAIKKAITSQEGIDPPAATTLAARKRNGFSGTKALIVTAQMRNAITYVVKSVWG